MLTIYDLWKSILIFNIPMYLLETLMVHLINNLIISTSFENTFLRNSAVYNTMLKDDHIVQVLTQL